MAEGRCREDWAHTSTVMALLANINRDPRKKSTPFKPADFDPYVHLDRKAAGQAFDDRLPGSIDTLVTVFVDRVQQKGLKDEKR